MDSAPSFQKFEQRPPSPQNAIDIFAGRWASGLEDVCPGVMAPGPNFFTGDKRPDFVANFFGRDGRLDGMSVLELGPLEAHHTYRLEKFGAGPILAIESNVEAFLKCLIVKEVLGLNARFVLGDFTEFLKGTSDKFDLVISSGVLYHMPDPILVIELIAGVTDRCFVWTHYYDENHYTGPPLREIANPRYPEIKMYSNANDEETMHTGRWWGGNKGSYSYLRRADLLGAFARAGLSSIEVFDETPSPADVAAITFAAYRKR